MLSASNSLKAGPRKKPHSAGLDHRKSQRLRLSLPVGFALETSDRRLEGHSITADVSGGGIRFAMPWSIPDRTTCQVSLELPNGAAPVVFASSVAWCRSDGSSRYEIGVAFAAASQQIDFVRYCHFIAGQLVCQIINPATQ